MSKVRADTAVLRELINDMKRAMENTRQQWPEGQPMTPLQGNHRLNAVRTGDPVVVVGPNRAARRAKKKANSKRWVTKQSKQDLIAQALEAQREAGMDV